MSRAGELAGRVVVVSGGGYGIGRAIALHLATVGMAVAVLDRDGSRAAAVSAEIVAAAGNAIAVEADVTDHAAMSAARDMVAASLGEVDALVNNAGIVHVARLLDTRLEDWRRVMAINLEGQLIACQFFVPGMVVRRRGAVVNMASWLGKAGAAWYGAYCASKAGLISLTQTLALEVAEAGVRVNAVCPGTVVETGQRDQVEAIHPRIGLAGWREREKTIPLGRVAQPHEIAPVVAWLLSDAAGYMTGEAVNVTGGSWFAS